MIINYPCKWEMSGSDIQPAFHSSLPVPPPSAFLPVFFFLHILSFQTNKKGSRLLHRTTGGFPLKEHLVAF